MSQLKVRGERLEGIPTLDITVLFVEEGAIDLETAPAAFAENDSRTGYSQFF
jgi:hypothetical protein